MDADADMSAATLNAALEHRADSDGEKTRVESVPADDSKQPDLQKLSIPPKLSKGSLAASSMQSQALTHATDEESCIPIRHLQAVSHATQQKRIEGMHEILAGQLQV